MPAETIPHRVRHQAQHRPDSPAYYEKSAGSWQATSWRAYSLQVDKAARALLALGLEPGGCVCILGFNRSEWTIADLAAMTAGGVPAGIYETCSAEEVAWIIQHSEAAVAIAENADQWEKIRSKREELPRLRRVVMMRGAPATQDPMVLSWDAFLALGDDTPPGLLEARLEGLRPEQPATYIYTSGTTGPPKAVMLSHRNLAWTAETARQVVGLTPEDCNLSYLPLAHIAEQVFSLHAPATAGSAVYFAESREKMPENLQEVQPTIFFGVPRVWEKMHAKIQAGLASAPAARKRIAGWAIGVGKAASHLKHQGEEPSGFLAIQHKLANKLVYSKLKPRLGLGRARVCVSGAAPISKEVLELFSGLDLTVHEVYGQSEDTGPTSFNVPGRTRLGTVGPAFPGVEIRIAADDEILVRGPNVFLGYYKDERATADALQDGWLHSGDLGAFDADGYLNITGRKKDILITSGGKNIAPKNLEAALMDLPLVSQAVVIGDRRKFLSAVVTLDADAAQAFASARGISGPLHEDKALLAEIQSGIDAMNKRFAQVEHIRKFRVLPRELSQEKGELTPTLKIKRQAVSANWAELIEGMYAE